MFGCKKCYQFMYVKETQKTKKCLRCGRSHKVSDIKNSGGIVKGMTNAVKTVKERQNKLAIQELGTLPEFKSLNDFRITKNRKSISKAIDNCKVENVYLHKFKKMLIELSEMYNEFPFYIIEMMAEDYGIPDSEIKLMTPMSVKQGILIRLNNNSYKIIIK
ncbi:MAG: DUF1922 domain-containing protein [Candidatus Lokiarchaeia archaeon]